MLLIVTSGVAADLGLESLGGLPYPVDPRVYLFGERNLVRATLNLLAPTIRREMA